MFNVNDFVYSVLSRLLYFMEDVGILQRKNTLGWQTETDFKRKISFDLLGECKVKQVTSQRESSFHPTDQPTLRFRLIRRNNQL